MIEEYSSNERPRLSVKARLSAWFSSVGCTENYLQSQTEESLLEGALTQEEQEEYRAGERDIQDSHRELCDRARTHFQRLGEQHRAELESAGFRTHGRR